MSFRSKEVLTKSPEQRFKVSELKERFGKDALEIADFIHDEISNPYDDFIVNVGNGEGYSNLGNYWEAIIETLKKLFK